MTIESDAEAFEEMVTLVDRYRDALERLANYHVYSLMAHQDALRMKDIARGALASRDKEER